jgi:hypothetical protein
MGDQRTEPEQSPQAGGWFSPRGHAGASLFLVLPVGVFVLANVIFSLIAFDMEELVAAAEPAVRSAGGSGGSLTEAAARIIWATSVVLFFSTFMAGALYCLVIVQRTVSGREKIRVVIGGSIIAALVLGYMALCGVFRLPFSYIFYFTFDALKASGRYGPGELLAVQGVISVLNVLAGLVPTLALMTGCCIMCGSSCAGTDDLERLEGQMRRLKIFTAMGSALLVTGVLHMIAWFSWPAALVADPAQSGRLITFSRSLGTFWGTTFSLCLATFYVPAAWSIHHRAAMMFQGSSRHDRGVELHGWLDQHGLSMAPLRQLPYVAVLLAPLLSGPIGSTLEQVSGVLAGP